MTSSTERGSPGPEGAPVEDRIIAPVEDRIIAALNSVSSQIDVAPRAFEPPVPCRHRGRNADPVRTPLRWVAVVALIVGVSGMVAISLRPMNDDLVVTGTSEDEGSPVDYEAPVDGSIDPVFLDYVVPVNGDERRLAERVFTDGYAWARAKSITSCLEDRGLTNAESFWALAVSDWYTGHGSPAEAKLPALQGIAGGGLDRPSQDVVSRQMSSVVELCSDVDGSKASQWQRRVEPLQKEFAVSVDVAIAEVEAGPRWEEVHRCLTGNGSPANDHLGRPRTTIDGYVSRIADARSSPESGAFARCATPFYADVERALTAPRDAFVARHQDELLRLQAEFASFA